MNFPHLHYFARSCLVLPYLARSAVVTVTARSAVVFEMTPARFLDGISRPAHSTAQACARGPPWAQRHEIRFFSAAEMRRRHSLCFEAVVWLRAGVVGGPAWFLQEARTACRARLRASPSRPPPAPSESPPRRVGRALAHSQWMYSESPPPTQAEHAFPAAMCHTIMCHTVIRTGQLISSVVAEALKDVRSRATSELVSR